MASAEPYRPNDGEEILGARSGSSTGYLLRWLDAVRQARESDESSGTDRFGDCRSQRDRSPDGPPEPIDMYRLFASDDWMVRPRLPQLTNPAPCEGIAQASLTSVHAETAVVMASPLYVRVLSLPEDEHVDDSAPCRHRRIRPLRRA
jgi:hypothetical protein